MSRPLKGLRRWPIHKFPPDCYWHPQKRCLVRVYPSLVKQAKGNTYDNAWSTGTSVDAQGFIVAAGAELYLIAGLLGLGLGYLVASRSRCPHYGEPTKVFPYGGRPYTGPWNGIDGNGTMHIGDRDFDTDHLSMAGPVKKFKGGKPYVDLRNGFVNPDELAKLTKAHNRNGYHRRKGQKGQLR